MRYVVAMADGYARASGRIGACKVHVAPGLDLGHIRRAWTRARVRPTKSSRRWRSIGVDLRDPAIDWVGLAHSLGVPGRRVAGAADIVPAIREATGRGGPSLIRH
jgi:thiamine pyrophosphate-dependent acetolactate synthase large subunit-like protein